ncbi:MAG: DNA-binding protein [Verrucomicrobiae bacterium]|nr:DNA-binding protein [Verrucomicrobiae bacterium]
MTAYIQQELFDTQKYEDEFISRIEKRLGGADEVSVSDVCAACNISATKVRAWIDEGEIVAVNHGTKQKAYWKIFAASVIGHYRRQLAGAKT